MDHPVSLDALQVLDAIDREGSFAAAASALHRVPSAITYGIRKLEEQLGVTLFDRSGHRAVLTADGRVVLERGQRLLDASAELQQTARRLATGWEPRLSIAVNSLIDLATLLPLIRRFHEAQPGIELALTEEVLDGSWDALESGRADLAIGAFGEAPRGMATLGFGPVEWVFVAAPEHPATRLPQPIDPAALKDATAVVAADSSRRRPARSAGLLDLRRRITV
ncbi:MAG TPA: LysR substrate-binding domain-containing protein, partial [Pseudomonadales bacterium]|nr:LysR substrate-binding domain-containing protein [Pseudomonadales bacterium]